MVAVRARRIIGSPTLLDLLVALVAFGLTLALLHAAHGSGGHLDPLGGVLAAAACFPLLARRRWPLGVFVVTTAASAALFGLNDVLGPPFGPTVALFFVASDERTRTRIRETAAVVLGMFAIHVGSTVIAHHGFPTSAILFGILVWGGAWMIGDQLHRRRQRHADLAERLSRERRLAAAEERTRIARDLHDSAAHAINVILVQAGAARLLQRDNPAGTREALTTIEVVARETIGEIDQLVRTLREDGGTNGGETVDPPIGLAALDTLIDRVRIAGLTVDVSVEGARRALAPAVDQAAYRILQESLTNAARHGGGATRVDLAYTENDLELTISNPLPAGAVGDSHEQGHGILGMRERATILGGSLEASGVDGRFRVRARLPYGGRPEW